MGLPSGFTNASRAQSAMPVMMVATAHQQTAVDQGPLGAELVT